MKRIVVITAIMFFTLAQALFGTIGLPVDSSNRSLASLISGLKEGNKGLKVSCALIIGEYRFEEATDVLSEILKSEDDADIKFAALVALYKIKTEAAVKVLRFAAENQEDSYLKAVATVLYTDIMSNQEADFDYEYTAK